MNNNLVKYMALCLGIGMCVYRLSTALGNIFSALSILLFLYLVYKYKKGNVDLFEKIGDDISCNQKMLCILIVSMLPNIIFSYDFKDSVKCFFDMWVYRLIAFWIITIFIKDKDTLLKMLLAFLTMEAVESAFVTYKAMNGVYRPAGFGNYVMHLAAILVMVFPILVVLISDSSFTKKVRFFSAIMAICILSGIIALQSRGVWLALVIVCPILIFKYVLRSKKHMVVALVIVSVITGFFVTTPKFVDRVKSITYITTDKSNADRIIVWESSFKMIKDHPITGVGLDCWKRTYEKQYKLKEVTQNMAHSHNNFIQMYAEAGLFGFLGFLSFTIFMLWSNFKAWVRTKNPYALMLFGVWSAFTLFGMIDNTIDGSAASKALWYLTGLLVALKSDYKKCR